MKSLLFLLALCLLFSSCAASDLPTPPADSTEITDSTPNTPSDPSQSETITNNTYNTVSEYEEMLKKAKLPEHFVHANAFKAFGTFTSVVYDGPKYSYLNGVTDSTGAHIIFEILHTPYYNTEKLEYTENADNENLFFLPDSKGWAAIKVGPMVYRYYDGKIHTAILPWEHGEIKIDWTPYRAGIVWMGKRTDYDLKADTALARLFTRSTAAAEANALLEAVRENSN